MTCDTHPVCVYGTCIHSSFSVPGSGLSNRGSERGISAPSASWLIRSRVDAGMVRNSVCRDGDAELLLVYVSESVDVPHVGRGSLRVWPRATRVGTAL